MRSVKPKIVLVLLLAAAMALLPGCVSTRNGVVVTKNKPDAALNDHIHLGLGYLGEGNRESARFHLQKAAAIDPRSPGVHNGLALLYQVELDPERAEKHYLRALSLDPDFSQARNNYAVFLYQQQRHEEAYQQFIRVSADTEYGMRAQVFVSLGLVARQLGNREDSLEHFKKAIALRPGLAVAYLELAWSYYEQQTYPEAKIMLSRHESLAKPGPRSLWLAILLEHEFGNRDAEESKGLALRKLFPYSRENLDYQEWLKNERTR